MRTYTVTKTVYSFDELSDKAKEKARDWFREIYNHEEWWNDSYEDAKTLGLLMGYKIDKIFFSGFSSQGDGACFEGSWNSADVQKGKAQEAAPKDAEIKRIALEFERLAAAYPGLSCKVKQSGRYMHEYNTVFDIEWRGEEVTGSVPLEAEEALIENSRDLMRWIYAQLEKEWDCLQSSESVDENIRANECEFSENGEEAQ